MTRSRPEDGYLPISDYALIGNMRAAALIARSGSLDWCCLPELDSPSVFAALLDRRRGGTFRLRLAGADEPASQQYVEGTNVLQTAWRGPGGGLQVTDYMPLRGVLDDPGGVEAPPEIHRRVACYEGSEAVAEVEWAPRFDFARSHTDMRVEEGRVVASGDGAVLTLDGLPAGSFEVSEEENGPVLRARLPVRAREPLTLVTRYGTPDASPRDDDRVLEMYHDTVRAWRGWIHVCDPANACAFSGRLHEAAVRSALTLKLLTYGPTGAIAASPTTSLPEEIGGARNWDYRFSWVRDSSLISQSLFAMGHRREARAFLEWLEDTAERGGEGQYDLQIMFGLRGERDVSERAIPGLEGYRGSRPVRVGNAAAEQLQLDVYGELLIAGFELSRMGGRITPELWGFLAALADESCALWQEPDHGFWEVRSTPRHFVSSKVMLWAGLDRAIRMAEHFDWPGDLDRWRRGREEIHAAVLREGYDEGLGSFVRVFGSTELDASNLLIPVVEFLPVEDPRVQGTIDCTMDRLNRKGFVRRYVGEDGVPGGEGAFVLCTFWLVDALALSGRLDEAREVFDGIFECRNHVGLLPEEIDPDTRRFLGNYPQAFSQAGLINSALYLAEAEGRHIGRTPLIGSRKHRQEKGGRPGAG